MTNQTPQSWYERKHKPYRDNTKPTKDLATKIQEGIEPTTIRSHPAYHSFGLSNSNQ